MRVLCLHTLRADCNAPLTPLRVALPCFASTRSVQIATFPFSPAVRCWFLCLHTLRADCNLRHFLHVAGVQALPPHAPCRLQPRKYHRCRPLVALCLHTLRADCNASNRKVLARASLCLHTLRADCNDYLCGLSDTPQALPPHAPCRLQHALSGCASYFETLPPHAPCRLQPVGVRWLRALRALPPHAPCRLQL